MFGRVRRFRWEDDPVFAGPGTNTEGESMVSRGSRMYFVGASAGLVLAILALAVPPFVGCRGRHGSRDPGRRVPIQGPDNTAGLAAVIVASPEAGLGDDSIELATAAATSDFVGIGRVVAAPLSDITGGSWMTYVTGDSGLLVAEPASLRFGMYRLGGTSEFTTMTVERVYSATVTAGVWQTTTLTDQTNVYQTNTDGGFCLVASPCTFAEFKAQYPDATVLGLQVAIGTGIPVDDLVRRRRVLDRGRCDRHVGLRTCSHVPVHAPLHARDRAAPTPNGRHRADDSIGDGRWPSVRHLRCHHAARRVGCHAPVTSDRLTNSIDTVRTGWMCEPTPRAGCTFTSTRCVRRYTAHREYRSVDLHHAGALPGEGA